jgi:acyl-coenzyme A thioesterase PaaI-like protein
MTENTLKWLMRFYPPLFFQRIWVKKIDKGFKAIEVKINRSLFTTNLGNSIFGGTIFSATDPFYALLFGQVLRQKGYHVTVWLKSAQINYLKPGRSNLHFRIEVNDEMIAEAEQTLQQQGKFIKAYPIHVYDRSDVLCATAINEVYIRNLDFVKVKE